MRDKEKQQKFVPGELRRVIGSQSMYRFVQELSGFAFRPFEQKKGAE